MLFELSAPLQKQLAPLPSSSDDEGALVSGHVILTRVLHFLCAMLRHLELVQSRRRAASLDPTMLTVRLRTRHLRI